MSNSGHINKPGVTLLLLAAATLGTDALAQHHHGGGGGGYRGGAHYGGGGYHHGGYYHGGPGYYRGTVIIGAPLIAPLPLLMPIAPPQPVIIQSQPVIIQQAPPPQTVVVGQEPPAASPGGGAAPVTGPTVGAPPPPATMKVAGVPDDVTLGLPTAPVEVIIYGAFTNIASAQFYMNALPQLRKEFVDTGRIRVVLRDLPLDQVSTTASLIAKSERSKEHYLKYADIFYKNQQAILTHKDPLSFIKELASKGGLPKKEVSKAIANPTLAGKLANGTADAKNNYNMQTTPTLIPMGKKIIGYAPDYMQLKMAIEAALK